MLAATLLCLFLGIEGFFGRSSPESRSARRATQAAQAAPGGEGVTGRGIAPDAIRSIQGFAFAFFIPIYFAIVGLQLDLLRGFNVRFFLLFLLLACAVKAGTSTWARGSRARPAPRRGTWRWR